jgi:hypothetical protein
MILFLQLEFHFFHITAVTTNEQFKLSRLVDVLQLIIVETKIICSKCKLNLLTFSFVDLYFFEAF